ncbi:hypothetical protein [Spirillospora sp. NPDC047279]|uniref:hypothetical protein n=1 Tax=Spirillospora sp. NPDC047279 TaxID=3155478 RepID=UPI003402128C
MSRPDALAAGSGTASGIAPDAAGPGGLARQVRAWCAEHDAAGRAARMAATGPSWPTSSSTPPT